MISEIGKEDIATDMKSFLNTLQKFSHDCEGDFECELKQRDTYFWPFYNLFGEYPGYYLECRKVKVEFGWPEQSYFNVHVKIGPVISDTSLPEQRSVDLPRKELDQSLFLQLIKDTQSEHCLKCEVWKNDIMSRANYHPASDSGYYVECFTKNKEIVFTHGPFEHRVKAESFVKDHRLSNNQ